MAEAPPLSIRLGSARTVRVEAHMGRTGLALRAAVLDLVDTGLETLEGEKSVEVPAARPSKAERLARAKAVLAAKEAVLDRSPRHVDAPLGPVKPAYGALLKGSPKKGGR